MIKIQRLRWWLWHVMRMSEDKVVKKVLQGGYSGQKKEEGVLEESGIQKL